MWLAITVILSKVHSSGADWQKPPAVSILEYELIKHAELWARLLQLKEFWIFDNLTYAPPSRTTSSVLSLNSMYKIWRIDSIIGTGQDATNSVYSR